MGNRYLAIDIGETAGRCILGSIENKKLVMEEIHHFQNTVVEKDGESCWDLEGLFSEIKTGIRKCREADKLPIFIGVDAWGADFVLLDCEDKVIGNAAACQNTISQLKNKKEKNPDHLENAECMLMIPDYFHFLLTGRKLCEYTNSLTSRLIDQYSKSWDQKQIEALECPMRIFPKLSQPGTILGNLTLEVNEEVGYDCIVVQPAFRGTGAAILTVTSEGLTDCSTVKPREAAGTPEAAKPLEAADKPEASEPLEAAEPQLEAAEPLEAAVGNLMVLMISSHELKDLPEAKECLVNTFYSN